MKAIIVSVLAGILLLSSCYVNRTTVGYGPVGVALNDRTFSKVKQHYLFWGFVRLGQKEPVIPQMGMGFQVKSGFTFMDLIFTGITAGIYGSRTVKILVSRQVEKAVKEQQEGKQ